MALSARFTLSDCGRPLSGSALLWRQPPPSGKPTMPILSNMLSDRVRTCRFLAPLAPASSCQVIMGVLRSPFVSCLSLSFGVVGPVLPVPTDSFDAPALSLLPPLCVASACHLVWWAAVLILPTDSLEAAFST